MSKKWGKTVSKWLKKSVDVPSLVRQLRGACGISGVEINSGGCDGFAYRLASAINARSRGEAKATFIDSFDEGHGYVEYQGKFYDAETPNGVSNPKMLPWYKRKGLNRVPSHFASALTSDGLPKQSASNALRGKDHLGNPVLALPISGRRLMGSVDVRYATKMDAEKVARQLANKRGFENTGVLPLPGGRGYIVAWGHPELLKLLPTKFDQGDHQWLGQNFGYTTEAIRENWEWMQNHKSIDQAKGQAKTPCYACDRPLGKNPKLVTTADEQTVYVGSECYKLILASGSQGYQPPLGGPRLYLLEHKPKNKAIDQAKVIAIDLNGTLASGRGKDPEGWGEPQPDAVWAMQQLKDKGYILCVNSVVGDEDAIKGWLEKHDLLKFFDYINESPAQPEGSSDKLNAVAMVDDRGWNYDGDWKRTLNGLFESGILEKSMKVKIAPSESMYRVDAKVQATGKWRVVRIHVSRELAEKIAERLRQEQPGVEVKVTLETKSFKKAYKATRAIVTLLGGKKLTVKLDEMVIDAAQEGKLMDRISEQMVDQGHDVTGVEIEGNESKVKVFVTKVVKRLDKGQYVDDTESDNSIWVLTTGDVDRDGETVDPEGVDFSEFDINPVVLDNHNTDGGVTDVVLGKIVRHWLDDVGEGTKWPQVGGGKRAAQLGEIEWNTSTQKGRDAQKMAKAGQLNGGSISFVPLDEPRKNAGDGNHYGKVKLLEFTLCPIGSNPSAVRVKSLRSGKRYKLKKVDKGWKEFLAGVGVALGGAAAVVYSNPQILSQLQQLFERGKKPEAAAMELMPWIIRVDPDRRRARIMADLAGKSIKQKADWKVWVGATATVLGITSAALLAMATRWSSPEAKIIADLHESGATPAQAAERLKPYVMQDGIKIAGRPEFLGRMGYRDSKIQYRNKGLSDWLRAVSQFASDPEVLSIAGTAISAASIGGGLGQLLAAGYLGKKLYEWYKAGKSPQEAAKIKSSSDGLRKANMGYEAEYKSAVEKAPKFIDWLTSAAIWIPTLSGAAMGFYKMGSDIVKFMQDKFDRGVDPKTAAQEVQPLLGAHGGGGPGPYGRSLKSVDEYADEVEEKVEEDEDIKAAIDDSDVPEQMQAAVKSIVFRRISKAKAPSAPALPWDKWFRLAHSIITVSAAAWPMVKDPDVRQALANARDGTGWAKDQLLSLFQRGETPEAAAEAIENKVEDQYLPGPHASYTNRSLKRMMKRDKNFGMWVKLVQSAIQLTQNPVVRAGASMLISMAGAKLMDWYTAGEEPQEAAEEVVQNFGWKLAQQAFRRKAVVVGDRAYNGTEWVDVREINGNLATVIDDKGSISRVAVGTLRKGKNMKKRKCWVNKRLKTAWLLKSEGDPLTPEEEETLSDMGVEEVQVEDEAPESFEDWAEEEMAEEEHKSDGTCDICGAKTKPGQPICEECDPDQGEEKALDNADKVEDIAEDVGDRAEEIVLAGAEDSAAISAAMMEGCVPLELQPEVKRIVRRRMRKAGRRRKSDEYDYKGWSVRELDEDDIELYSGTQVGEPGWYTFDQDNQPMEGPFQNEQAAKREIGKSYRRKSFGDDNQPLGLKALKSMIKAIEEAMKGPPALHKSEQPHVIDVGERALKMLKAALRRAYKDSGEEDPEALKKGMRFKCRGKSYVCKAVYDDGIAQATTGEFFADDGLSGPFDTKSEAKEEEEEKSDVHGSRTAVGDQVIIQYGQYLGKKGSIESMGMDGTVTIKMENGVEVDLPEKDVAVLSKSHRRKKNKRLSKADTDVVKRAVETLESMADGSDLPKHLKGTVRGMAEDFKSLCKSTETISDDPDAEVPTDVLERLEKSLDKGDAAMKRFDDRLFSVTGIRSFKN